MGDRPGTRAAGAARTAAGSLDRCARHVWELPIGGTASASAGSCRHDGAVGGSVAGCSERLASGRLASVPARREMAGSSSYTVRVRIWSAGLLPLQAARAASFCPTCVTSDDDYDNFASTVLAKQFHRAHHPVQRHRRWRSSSRSTSASRPGSSGATVDRSCDQDARTLRWRHDKSNGLLPRKSIIFTFMRSTPACDYAVVECEERPGDSCLAHFGSELARAAAEAREGREFMEVACRGRSAAAIPGQ